jgi:hypothetical protein
MKNVFVELTEFGTDGIGKVTIQSCWVNMSRVQEMRVIIAKTDKGDMQITELTMNIPDYQVQVMEHPGEILSRLKKVNAEQFEVCDD